jgi:alpha-tubulin suppressor-like RCC1 family protein
VPLPEPVREVAAGFEHTCAILASGRVICWGEAAIERERPPRDDEVAPPFTPTEVAGLPPVVALTSGDFDSCALGEDGSVFCWGFVRTGDFSGRVIPLPGERVPGIDDAVGLSAGHEFVCALRRGGRVGCWGNNERGQLGDGGANVSAGAIVEPVGLPPSIHVTGGWRHACALDEAGAVRCWGRDWEGQLGDGLGGEHRLPTVAAVFRD